MHFTLLSLLVPLLLLLFSYCLIHVNTSDNIYSANLSITGNLVEMSN